MTEMPQPVQEYNDSLQATYPAEELHNKYQDLYDTIVFVGALQIDSGKLKSEADKLDYREKAEIKKEPKKRDVSFNEIKQLPFWGGDFARTLIYFIAFIILAAIVYYLLTKTIGQRNREDYEINVGLSEATDADNLAKLPVDALLTEALANADYRLAVRLLYLKILKELFAKGLIYPSAEKTNHDYLHELGDTEFRQPFMETTGYFEKVFYGDFSLSANSYKALSGKFNHFFHSIRIR